MRVVVVNYKQQRIVPLFSFMAFVLVCLIGLPIWTAVRLGAPQGPYAGKLLVAPLFGLCWLFLIARTLSFNARVRRDPRALQWDALGLNLWQDGRAERLQWVQVGQVSILQGRRPSYPSFLKIATKGADGRPRNWRFSSSRLQLSGQPLGNIAEQIERARSGDPAPAGAIVPAQRDRQAANERYEQRLAKARAIVAVVMSAYFITLVGVIVHLSSNTMLLTPHDPLLWQAAKIAFFGTSGAILLWYVKTIYGLWPMSWRVALWFLPKVMVPGIMSGAMMGLWAYLAANVYVTDKTWSGHVEHGAVLMVVLEPMITHHGQPTVEARLRDRPGQDVFFTIDVADAQLLRHWHDPGYIDEPACLTVPVQWVGYAIRSEVTTDTPLPKGSLSTCS